MLTRFFTSLARIGAWLPAGIATGSALVAVSACAASGSSHAPDDAPVYASRVNTPRATGMPLPKAWYCFGHVGSRWQPPSTDCYPTPQECGLAQVEHQVARTGLSCAQAGQAYCTSPAATPLQPHTTFAYSNRASCFAAPHYCENHRRQKLNQNVAMSECQLIQDGRLTTFPPL